MGKKTKPTALLAPFNAVLEHNFSIGFSQNHGDSILRRAHLVAWATASPH